MPAYKPPKHAVLRTAAESERLARSDIPLALFGSGTITLDLPIDKAVQARFQAELTRLLGTCGCVESSMLMFVLLASGLVGIWGLGLGESLGMNRWASSAGVFTISTGLALLVKFAILSRARRRFRESVLRLAGLVAAKGA